MYKLSKFNVDGVIESPIYCVAAVFRNSAYYMYCPVSEKPLRLFIPLIFSGGCWNFLLSIPRAFPVGTIGDTFYKTVNVAFTTLIYSGNWLNN